MITILWNPEKRAAATGSINRHGMVIRESIFKTTRVKQSLTRLKQVLKAVKRLESQENGE
ncbi:MAG: hypothetical protein JEZ06_03325 [Anaerolineaceae bacterium]|nr:hypothetical protein [Anaerolineaceae bacterium]